MKGTYECKKLCDLIHAHAAKVLDTYENDFYIWRPALTENTYGEGKAYYIASRNEASFQKEFFEKLIDDLKIQSNVGVVASKWVKEDKEYIFIQNFTEEEQIVPISAEGYMNLATGEVVINQVELSPYEVMILSRNVK